MSKRITGSGYVIVIVGLVLLTPAGDFLPVDLWRSAGSQSEYWKVIPVVRTYALEIAFVGIGLVLVVFGKTVSRRS